MSSNSAIGSGSPSSSSSSSSLNVGSRQWRIFIATLFVLIVGFASLSYKGDTTTVEHKPFIVTDVTETILTTGKSFEDLTSGPLNANTDTDARSLVHHSSHHHHKYIHIYFMTMILPPKVLMALRSALITQKGATIILWTESHRVDDITIQVKPLQENFACGHGTTLEVWSVEQLKLKLKDSTDLHINAEKCSMEEKGNAVANSDMFRFLVLFMYGGIYVDADTIFLKDLTVFHGESFGFKWGGGGSRAQDYNNWYQDHSVREFNTAIMGLPKGSPIPGRIAAKAGCTAHGFYPIRVGANLDCDDPDIECDGFAMVPTILFDPVHSPWGNEKCRSCYTPPDGVFSGGDPFFTKPSNHKDLSNFAPGSFTYHWHNRWDLNIHPDSTFAKLDKKFSSCAPLVEKQASMVLAGVEAPRVPLVAVKEEEGSSTVPTVIVTETLVSATVASTEKVTTTPTLTSSCKLAPRKIFIDLGMWKGDTLGLYAQRFMMKDSVAGGGFTSNARKMWAFETDPKNIQVVFNKMKGDFSGDSMRRPGDELLSKIRPFTNIIHACAWDTDTIMNFHNVDGNRNSGQVDSGGKESSGGSSVMCYDFGNWLLSTVEPTMDDYIILKIDIESAEEQVLPSLQKLKALDYVDHLIVEWHNWQTPDKPSIVPRFESMLSTDFGLNYQYATLDDKLGTKFTKKDHSDWPVHHCDSHYIRDSDIHRVDYMTN